MKFILTIFLAILSFHSYSQEKPQQRNPSSSLILYPEVYQIITLERTSDFQLSVLERICEEHHLNLIAVEDELSILIEHSNNQTYENSKEAILENVNSIFKNTATIKSTQSYGKEYLPSVYLRQTILKKFNLNVNYN